MHALARTTALTGMAVLGLALSACDSKAENEVEQQATALDEAYEADADLEESMAAGGPQEDAAGERADAMRQEGEETKDELEDMADEMDSTPQ